MIDLKATFGRTYRITLDESAEIQGQTREDRLWLYQIPCKYGHVYVHGEETLGAFARGAKMVGMLARLEGVKVHQRGDAECSVTFPPELLPTVAGLLRAYRRRHLSPERQAAGADRLRQWRENRAMAHSPE